MFEASPRSDLLYPRYPRPNTDVETAALEKGVHGTCPVCGRRTLFTNWTTNFRESGECQECGSFNRQRQIALTLRRCLGISVDDPWPTCRETSIYNTESHGSLHEALSVLPGYHHSEYYSDGQPPGGRHEDLQRLSFPDASFDVALSSDVLEHVPEPYQAHREIRRVLKPGGSHIFTVPFYPYYYFDEVRAYIKDGQLIHVKEPIYHSDPIRPEGALVYTIFSLEMLAKLHQAGFQTYFYTLYEPDCGILGWDSLVFQGIGRGE